MRQIPPQKRARGRGNGRKHPQPTQSRSFDSNGPTGHIRGNASQVSEKYQALARDAQTLGDRIMAENYFQHAEHYYRIMAAAAESQSARFAERRQPQGEQPQGEQPQGEQPQGELPQGEQPQGEQPSPNGGEPVVEAAEPDAEAEVAPAEAEPTAV
jgi:hypothetical protein